MLSIALRGFLCGIMFGLAAGALAADDGAAKPGLANPLFAFDNGTGRSQNVPPEEQAKTLKELGYAGIGWIGTQQLPEMLKALDAQGLKMYSMYVDALIGPGMTPYGADLKSAIEQLKGRDTLILLVISGGNPSSVDLDGRAVDVIRQIADMAERSGLRIALYPHVGVYVARVDDALRLVKKVDRKNVGVSFNLCHFLKLDNEKNLERSLKDAMPHLFAVSINGTDGGQTNQMGWDRLIQTLDRGDFDVGRVLRTLKQLGYTGPVGLQCHGITGDWRGNLKRSINGWRTLCKRVRPVNPTRPTSRRD